MSEQLDIVVPVLREDWQITKELRETGTVRVVKTQSERQEIVRDQLLTETVEIERVPVSRVVTEVPPMRVENGVTIIPVVREFAVVVKELRVVEEIRVMQRVGGVPFEQPITLREQTVVVERGPAMDVNSLSEPDTNTEELRFHETAESAVVTKAAHVVEEVRIGKETTERTETIHDVLRSTDVEVDRLPGIPR